MTRSMTRAPLSIDSDDSRNDSQWPAMMTSHRSRLTLMTAGMTRSMTRAPLSIDSGDSCNDSRRLLVTVVDGL
jgi:hypothetical protein